VSIENKTIWTPALLPGLSQLYSTKFLSNYFDFRKVLITPFKRVQFSLVVNWLSIAFLLFFTRFTSKLVFHFIIAIVLSLLMHRALLIIHEGAHYHLSADKSMNDKLSNLFAGWFVFTDVKSYRVSHIQHHRGLGSSTDPENTHMEKLDLSWILSAITGFKTVLAFMKTIRAGKNTEQKSHPRTMIPIVGAIIHVGIFLVIYIGLGLTPFLIWSVSLLVFAPMLGMLRNLLEHRYVEAVDPVLWEIFLNSNQKPVELNQITTRTFTQSIFSKLYGSMGFTRHLLHHWDPSISYMNLEKVHDFLLSSEVGELLKKTDSTYTKTFFYLFGR
jgi:fatty acid desaturase